MEEHIELPDGVDAARDGDTITISSDGTETAREFDYPSVQLDVADDGVTVRTESDRRNDKAVFGTYVSHIQNMIEGVQEDYEYRLKTVYAHFPMSVKTEGDQVVIQNFIGERAPRRVDIMDNVDVQVDDEEVIVTGPSKERVSQTAARIEQACSKGSRDPRRFQDGVYLTSQGD